MQHTVDVGYYAPAARTTLNPAVFIVFLSEIHLRPATPEYTPSGLGRVPSATRLWLAAPRHYLIRLVLKHLFFFGGW